MWESGWKEKGRGFTMCCYNLSILFMVFKKTQNLKFVEMTWLPDRTSSVMTSLRDWSIWIMALEGLHEPLEQCR